MLATLHNPKPLVDIRMAIARDKEIKASRRQKKIWLIERGNRTREDLAETL